MPEMIDCVSNKVSLPLLLNHLAIKFMQRFYFIFELIFL